MISLKNRFHSPRNNIKNPWEAFTVEMSVWSRCRLSVFLSSLNNNDVWHLNNVLKVFVPNFMQTLSLERLFP